MNAPLRFDLSISPEKLARALKAGLDENRQLKWWQHVTFFDHGSRLIQHEDFKCIARDGMIRVTVKELHYHIIRESLQRSIQLLADFYPRALGAVLSDDYYNDLAADKLVQCALFGKVRFVKPKRYPSIPTFGILEAVSKADIFEAAWDLASLCNEAGSADDEASTGKKLLEMINTRREQRGARPHRIDIDDELARLAARRAEAPGEF